MAADVTRLVDVENGRRRPAAGRGLRAVREPFPLSATVKMPLVARPASFQEPSGTLQRAKKSRPICFFAGSRLA